MPRCASPKSCTRPTTTARRLHHRHRALLPQHSVYHAPVRQLEELHAHGDCCAAAAPPPLRRAASAAPAMPPARRPEALHARGVCCAATAPPPPRLAAFSSTCRATARQSEELCGGGTAAPAPRCLSSACHAAERQPEELYARSDCCAVAAALRPPCLAAVSSAYHAAAPVWRRHRRRHPSLRQPRRSTPWRASLRNARARQLLRSGGLATAAPRCINHVVQRHGAPARVVPFWPQPSDVH